jgi:hypothetical protein
MTRAATIVLLMLGWLPPSAADAQPLGSFRWQLQPFCNVVTLSVTQNGGVYRLEGTDDQCGNGGDRAAALGMAFQNPDGSIGFGFTVVTTPGGVAVHVDAAIALATLGGTWRDSAGNSGSFVFTPGGGTGGSLRPLPTGPVPVTIQLRADGGLVAGGSGSEIPASGQGRRLMWYPGKAALRAGQVNADQWDDANVGQSSVALGENVIASGQRSVALGALTRASGSLSTAFGDATQATGTRSTAMGSLTEASGVYSTAMGENTTASGTSSTAMGRNTTASGLASFAAGNGVSAGGTASVAFGQLAVAATSGTFVFGDLSPFAATLTTGVANQFLVRAAGGVGFYTNPALTAGVTLAAGGSAWASVSDRTRKREFRDLAGDDVLDKLARMPIQEWSYIAQDAAIRHVGPTAQDFHAAFGLGEDPLRISTIDADGIALRAIQALEARDREANEAQAAEIAALRARIAALLAQIAEVSARATARP